MTRDWYSMQKLATQHSAALTIIMAQSGVSLQKYQDGAKRLTAWRSIDQHSYTQLHREHIEYVSQWAFERVSEESEWVDGRV